MQPGAPRANIRRLLAVVGILAVIGGCATPGNVRQDHSIKRGSTSVLVVGKEKWSRYVIGGWFSFIYQPEGAEIRIGVSRAGDPALPPGSSDAAILRRELALLRRFEDATISAQFQDRIATDFGNVSCYQLQSSDPLWHLRSLVIYPDAAGQIVNIGFYSHRSSISSTVIRDYLNTMFRAKLITPR